MPSPVKVSTASGATTPKAAYPLKPASKLIQKPNTTIPLEGPPKKAMPKVAAIDLERDPGIGEDFAEERQEQQQPEDCENMFTK